MCYYHHCLERNFPQVVDERFLRHLSSKTRYVFFSVFDSNHLIFNLPPLDLQNMFMLHLTDFTFKYREIFVLVLGVICTLLSEVE